MTGETVNRRVQGDDWRVIDLWEHDRPGGRVCILADNGFAIVGYTQTSLEEVPEHLDVHGGVTYGPDDGGWIGIDFAHASSLAREWTERELRDEVDRLAREIDRVEEEVAP